MIWYRLLHPHRLKKVVGHVPSVPYLIATMGAGGLRVAKPLNIFSPPWKNVLDIFKNLGPSQTPLLPLRCPKMVKGLVLIKMQTERSQRSKN